jgi:hypothetical protein
MSKALVFDVGIDRPTTLVVVPPATAVEPEPRRSNRALALWLAGSIAATVAYFFVGDGVESIVYDVIGMAAGVAMLLGARGRTVDARLTWTMLGLGVMTLSAGDITFGVSQSGPSLADMFYVTGHVALATGLILTIRKSIRSGDRRTMIDSAIMASVALIASLVFIATNGSNQAGVSAQAVAIAYPVLDLILLGLIARLALQKGDRRSSYLLLGGGVLLMLVADAGYTLQDFGAGYSLGGGLDAAWLLSYVVLGAAALLPASSGRRAADVTEVRDSASGPRDLYLSMPTFSAWEALRVRRVLTSGGLISLGMAVATLFAGLPLHAPEMIFMSAVFGMSGMLMMLSSAVHSRA